MDAMKEAFGTRPEDVTACIGPSICRDCFEVGEEVAEAFADAFDPKYRDALYRANAKPGKYQLDLWKANEKMCIRDSYYMGKQADRPL